MPRFFKLIAVVSVVGVSMPALAHCRKGVGIQLGSVFIGATRHRHCHEVVVAAAPVVVQPAPPAVYVQPAPMVVQAPPPVVYSPPPIVYAPPAPVVVQAAPAPVPRKEAERPGFLAIKYMPGAASALSVSPGQVALGQPAFAHSPGLELRVARWLSLRSDLEFRNDGRTWDMLGLKLNPFGSTFKPYVSVSFSGNESYANPGRYSFGFAGAAGLDVLIGKHFFLEAEARYRMTPGACCSDVPSVVGVVGGGVAFF